MPIRIVVFDVLGTVVDERGSFRAAAEQEASLLSDPEAFARRWLDGVDATVSRIAQGAEPWRPWDEVVADRMPELGTTPLGDMPRSGCARSGIA